MDLQLALRRGAARCLVGTARNDPNERENGSETQGTPESDAPGKARGMGVCRLLLKHGHVEVGESGNRRLVGWGHRAVREAARRRANNNGNSPGGPGGGGGVCGWPLTPTVHTGHAVADTETPYSRAGNTRTSSASVGTAEWKAPVCGGGGGQGRWPAAGAPPPANAQSRALGCQ